MTGSLRRWWMNLFRARAHPAAAPESDRPAAPSGGGGDRDDGPARREPERRHYTAPHAQDDPQREAHLGAVLQALSTGPLTRAALGRAVGADDWGPGRLDAVVDHGLAAGVLRSDDEGATVRARYAD